MTELQCLHNGATNERARRLILSDPHTRPGQIRSGDSRGGRWDVRHLGFLALETRTGCPSGSWFRFATGVTAPLTAALLSAPSMASEPSDTPALAVAVRETADVWDVASGDDPGLTMLNKLQVSATVDGGRFGFDGWTAHAQIFRFDGQPLSARMDDIQTADNLEALPMTRLFEAWIARQWGAKDRSASLRFGVIDLNSQFDSVDPASLFINSSHGIGPDLSSSGRNGPSIYPVTSLGTTITLVPSDRWTFRLGVFDGVAGDPARPRAFLAERLGEHDGLLTIIQADYQLGVQARVEAGSWKYSASVPGLEGGRSHDEGAYASIEAPLPLVPRMVGWLRAGLADSRAQAVAGYIGGGVVQTGTFANRPEDRLGFAVAHAIIGAPAVKALGVSSAETSLEATYQIKVSERFALQPDIQYLLHPSGVAGARNSLGIGLRLVVTGGFPKKPQANDPSDPTVPADSAPTASPSDAQPAPAPE